MKTGNGMFLHNEVSEGGGGGSTATAMTPPPITVVNDGATAVGQQHGGGANVKVTFPEDWKLGLEETLRNDPSLGPVNDIPTLVKNYVNAQKMIGKNKIVVPDQHATPDDWRGVFQKLGLPPKIEEYQFNVPKDAKFDDGFLTELKKVAYQNNILPKQAESLVDWYAKANAKAIEGFNQKLETEKQAAIQGLKKEWGEAYDKKVAMARAAINASGLGEQIFSWLDNSGLGDDQNLIRLLSALGEKFQEDGIVQESSSNTVNMSDLDSQISEIQGNFDHPYYNKRHPNHAAAVRQMEQLLQLKYGNGPSQV